MLRRTGYFLQTITRTLCLGVLWGWILAPAAILAHPMGNFSINHFSKLEVERALLELTYVIDMAEIPAFQEMQKSGITKRSEDQTLSGYARRKSGELMRGLTVEQDGRPLTLSVRSSKVAFPPGLGGLPTLRMTAIYEVPLAAPQGEIVYEDRNYPRRIGWKEIIAAGQKGILLSEATVPGESLSNELRAFDRDLLQSPLQLRRAVFSFAATSVPGKTPGVMAPSESAEATGAASRWLASLVTPDPFDMKMVWLALLAAAGLGALHALEPGHGKTLVAAYLVGAKGTARHALLLGLIVTASHTAGVYALGGVTWFASPYLVPERLYSWLGLASGTLILFMGACLLARVLSRQMQHGDFHGHVHTPSQLDDHAHPHHPHGPEIHRNRAGVSYPALFTLGVTGGMIPCPAALVVLLGSVALQRVYLGLLLIVAFSAGLALVLIGMGLAVVYGGRLLTRFGMEGPLITRWLPVASALIITGFGLAIFFQAFLDTGLA